MPRNSPVWSGKGVQQGRPRRLHVEVKHMRPSQAGRLARGHVSQKPRPQDVIQTQVGGPAFSGEQEPESTFTSTHAHVHAQLQPDYHHLQIQNERLCA